MRKQEKKMSKKKEKKNFRLEMNIRFINTVFVFCIFFFFCFFLMERCERQGWIIFGILRDTVEINITISIHGRLLSDIYPVIEFDSSFRESLIFKEVYYYYIHVIIELDYNVSIAVIVTWVLYDYLIIYL